MLPGAVLSRTPQGRQVPFVYSFFKDFGYCRKGISGELMLNFQPHASQNAASEAVIFIHIVKIETLQIQMDASGDDTQHVGY